MPKGSRETGLVNLTGEGANRYQQVNLRPAAYPEKIASYIATIYFIRHRTKRSKGCLSRDGMLHMKFKLGQCAEKKWRKLRGFEYLAKVVTGIKFKDGIEVIDIDQVAA